MGAIQQSTRAMNGWGIEMRGSSFYLHDPEPGIPGNRDNFHFVRTAAGFAVAADDAAAVVASLELAADWVRKHWTPDETGHYANRGKGEDRGLTIRHTGDMIEIAGPLHEHRWGHERATSLEFTYAELPSLLQGFKRQQ